MNIANLKEKAKEKVNKALTTITNCIIKILKVLHLFSKTALVLIVIMAMTLGLLHNKISHKIDNIYTNIRIDERQKIIADAATQDKDKLTTAIMSLQPKLDKDMAIKIASSIKSEAEANHLDEALVAAVIQVESEFNPFAENPSTAFGLMQIRYSVWKETPELVENGVSARGALFWVDRNIKAGTKILSKYYRESNCNLTRALYRYNTGSLNLPGGDPYASRYVNSVMRYAYEIKVMLDGDSTCLPINDNPIINDKSKSIVISQTTIQESTN